MTMSRRKVQSREQSKEVVVLACIEPERLALSALGEAQGRGRNHLPTLKGSFTSRRLGSEREILNGPFRAGS
jgi:hypothetical protein